MTSLEEEMVNQIQCLILEIVAEKDLLWYQIIWFMFFNSINACIEYYVFVCGFVYYMFKN
jgi:hypothetical protein